MKLKMIAAALTAVALAGCEAERAEVEEPVVGEGEVLAEREGALVGEREGALVGEREGALVGEREGAVLGEREIED